MRMNSPASNKMSGVKTPDRSKSLKRMVQVQVIKIIPKANISTKKLITAKNTFESESKRFTVSFEAFVSLAQPAPMKPAKTSKGNKKFPSKKTEKLVIGKISSKRVGMSKLAEFVIFSTEMGIRGSFTNNVVRIPKKTRAKEVIRLTIATYTAVLKRFSLFRSL